MSDYSRTIGARTLAAAMLLGWAACPLPAPGGEAVRLGEAEVYSVLDVTFSGPNCTAADTPARDIELRATFRHARTGRAHTLWGFWDGDGKGGAAGNVFVVRFCPTAAGKWTITEVRSNAAALKGEHEGDYVTAVAGKRRGFWLPDGDTPGSRWYKRSDGSHPYIFGNTHYTFLSGRTDRGDNGSAIADDVKANAKYFKKLRFSLYGGRYVHPSAKPFLDDAGKGTDDGNFSHRPNPAWFHRRADAAVKAALEADLIADLILNGPDTAYSRSVLAASRNRGDNTPFLRYIAARYGSYPNVWMCLANEWNIKKPSYSPGQISRAGAALRAMCGYPVPISVHGNRGNWNRRLNTAPAWNDHVILQGKIRTLGRSADFIASNHRLGGRMPVINDELGYEGAGDRFSRDDVIEGHLGAFLGGGYGTTGFKPAGKKGHYFWGAFKPAEHTAAAHLAYLRGAIDEHITFWRMQPVATAGSIFSNAGRDARAMAWAGRQYVLGTSSRRKGIVAALPKGKWHVRRFDAIARKTSVLAEAAAGRFTFDAPPSRAVLFHFRSPGNSGQDPSSGN